MDQDEDESGDAHDDVDLQEKYREGVEWFQRAVGEVEEANVRVRLGAM